MIHETFLCLTEPAFGRHPCRVVSVTYRKLRPFHGGNTGSNPVGDANHLVLSQYLTLQLFRFGVKSTQRLQSWRSNSRYAAFSSLAWRENCRATLALDY